MSKLIFKKKLPLGFLQVWDDKPKELKLTHVHQVHSADIVNVKDTDLEEIKADGIVANIDDLKGKNLAIKTADCMPAIFIGKEKVVFVHAGWMGLYKGILIAKKIQEINPYYCYIGPSIQKDHFQVQKDFYQYFDPKSGPYIHKKDKLYFDLQHQAQNEIKNIFPDIELEISSICTHCKSEYNSYRRDKTQRRNWNIFSL